MIVFVFFNLSDNDIEVTRRVVEILKSYKIPFNSDSFQQTMENYQRIIGNYDKDEIYITNDIIQKLLRDLENSYYYIILYDSNYNDKNRNENISDLLNYYLLNYFRDELGIGFENPLIIYEQLVDGLNDYISENENSVTNITQFVDGTFMKMQNLIIDSLKNNQALQDQQKSDIIEQVKRVLNDRINDIKETYKKDTVYIEEFIRNIIFNYIYIRKVISLDDQNISIKVWLFIIIALIVFLQMIKDKRLYQRTLFYVQTTINQQNIMNQQTTIDN